MAQPGKASTVCGMSGRTRQLLLDGSPCSSQRVRNSISAIGVAIAASDCPPDIAGSSAQRRKGGGATLPSITCGP